MSGSWTRAVVVSQSCAALLWMQTWALTLPLTLPLTVPLNAWAGPFEEGIAAGRAAAEAARSAVSAGGARAVVPDYTPNPPQTIYKGQTGLAAIASAQLAACAATPDDIACQAQTTAMTSANTPRPSVGPYDSAVQGARAIAANPSLTLGSLSAYYSGCATAEATRAASTVTQVCNRYTGIGKYACRRDLSVDVTRVQSCAPGTWIDIDHAYRNGSGGADQIHMQALCEPERADGRMLFRANAYGSRGSCSGWVSFEVDMAAPTANDGWRDRVATLDPHWSGSCGWPLDVYQVGPGCMGDACSKTFHYVRWPPDRSRPAEEIWRALKFQRPGMVAQETDAWLNNCPVLAAGGRCTTVAGERCVDGPGVKKVNGRDVKRPCWAYETTFNCQGAGATDECAPLAAAGCTPQGSTCKQTDPQTNTCLAYQDTYSCPQAPSLVTTASNCPTSKFCLGANCFDTSSVADPDFARSMSMLEGAREAGVYLDTRTMTVFNGEGNRCGVRAWKNCCSQDASGKGMTNQSLFGVGSTLVYDVLMNAENRAFITQGLQALLMDGGFSGSFTSYGVTVAVNGTALPAGSTVLASGQNVVVAFDPWSLAIAVVIYVALSDMSCDKDEVKLTMKRGAALCHEVGSYCSNKVLGTCLTTTHAHCCFNSVLARIVNEQGRSQVSKGWGEAKAPDCSGFSIAQLQSLDFAQMDFSEFYASISPKLMDAKAAGAFNAARVSTCYYGQGRC